MKRFFCICIMILFPCGFVSGVDEKGSPTLIYDSLRARAEGDFNTAFMCAERLFVNGDTELKMMALYLVDEMASIPDLVPESLKCLGRINTSGEPDDVKRLHSIISLHLLTRNGDYVRAAQLRRELGFIGSINVSRPIHIENGEAVENVRSMIERRTSRFPDLSETFIMQADSEGVFGFDSFYKQCGQKAFKADTVLNISENGYYRIRLGRAGKIILEIDGTRVFSASDIVSYSPDQICIRGFLGKGTHRVEMFLAGDDNNSLSASMRIVPDRSDDREAKSSGWTTECESYNDDFIAGFICYKKGLGGIKNAVKSRMDRVSPDNILYPYARYYSAKSENDPAHEWKILEEGTARYLDPFLALYRIKKELVRYGKNNVYVICRKMMSEHPQSVFTEMCNMELSLESGWTEDASKRAESIQNRGYPLLADEFRVRTAAVCEGARSPYENYLRLFKSGIDGKKILSDISAAFEDGHKTDSWIELLEHAISRDGYGIYDMLTAAEYWVGKRDYGKALPMLTALLKRVPENTDVLYDLGRVYYGMGRDDLAKFHFDRAYAADPQNEKFRFARSIMSLAEERDISLPDKFLIDEGKKNRNNAVICLEKTMILEISPAGEYEKRVRESYLVNDGDMAKELTKRSVVIDGTIESLDDIRYYSIHSGKVRESRVVDSSSLSDEESGTYSDLVQYEISVPKFQSGDILIFEYAIRSAGTAVKGCYDERISLGGEFKTLFSRITLVDKSGFLNWKAYNCIPKVSDKRGNGRDRIIDLTLSDIDRVPDEKAMVPAGEMMPEIRVSSFKTYDDLYSWFRSRIKEREGLSAGITTIIDELVGNEPDKGKKAASIYRYFTDKIRYIGFENNRGGYIPRKSDETFKSGAGDCKDTAFLVTQAMRYAGIDADMVLLLTSDMGKTDREFPSLSAFNHAVCRINLGKPVYLDCTVNGRELDELPDADRDVDAFVISDEKGFFEIIDGAQYVQKGEKIYTEAEIGRDGSLIAKRTVEKSGYPHDGEKGDGGSREEEIFSFWNERYRGVTVSGFSEERKGRTVITRYEIGIGNYGNVSDEEMIFSTHLLKSLLSAYAKTPSRKTDMKLTDRQDIFSVVKYAVPEGYTVASVPANEDLSYSGIRYRTEYAYDNKSITVSTYIRMTPMEISAKEYPDFRRVIRKIANDQNTVISLVKGN